MNGLHLQLKVNFLRLRDIKIGALAQLARAFDWQSKGQGFDSPRLHFLIHQEERLSEAISKPNSRPYRRSIIRYIECIKVVSTYLKKETRVKRLKPIPKG